MEVLESKVYFIEDDGLPENNENIYFIYNNELINGIPIKYSKNKGENENTWVSLVDKKIYYNVNKYLIFNEIYTI